MGLKENFLPVPDLAINLTFFARVRHTSLDPETFSSTSGISSSGPSSLLLQAAGCRANAIFSPLSASLCLSAAAKGTLRLHFSTGGCTEEKKDRLCPGTSTGFKPRTNYQSLNCNGSAFILAILGMLWALVLGRFHFFPLCSLGLKS